MFAPYETGQGDDLGGLEDSVGSAVGGILASSGAQAGIKDAMVNALDSPEVQDAIARAARPVALEFSLYLGVAIAFAIWIGRR